MLAYDMKDILRIVPEAVTLTKEASFSEEFPLNNKDSVLASGLRVEYMTKVAGKQVSFSTMEKVADAVTAYGLKDQLTKYASRIEEFGKAEKKASLYDKGESLALQEEVVRGGLGYGRDLVKVASYAEQVFERFSGENVSVDTQRYAGALPFGEGEVRNALEKRAYETKDPRYTEVLNVVSEFGVDSLNFAPREKRAHVAKMVAGIDSELHYNGDFYKEAFVKQASYGVKLNKKTVPYETIQRAGKEHIADLVGKDVASALTGDYANDKAVLESLPIGEKDVLERFL